MDRPSEERGLAPEASSLVRAHETFTMVEPPVMQRETRFQKFRREFDAVSFTTFMGIMIFIVTVFWVMAAEYRNSNLAMQIKDLKSKNFLLSKRPLECPHYFVNETGKDAQQEQAQDMEYLDKLMERKREFEAKKKMIEAQDPEEVIKKKPIEAKSASLVDFVKGDEILDDEDYMDYENEKISEAVGNSTVHYDEEDEEDEENEEDGVVELPTDKDIEIPSETTTSV